MTMPWPWRGIAMALPWHCRGIAMALLWQRSFRQNPTNHETFPSFAFSFRWLGEVFMNLVVLGPLGFGDVIVVFGVRKCPKVGKLARVPIRVISGVWLKIQGRVLFQNENSSTTTRLGGFGLNSRLEYL